MWYSGKGRITGTKNNRGCWGLWWGGRDCEGQDERLGERDLVYIYLDVMVAARLYTGVNLYGTVHLQGASFTIRKVSLNKPDLEKGKWRNEGLLGSGVRLGLRPGRAAPSWRRERRSRAKAKHVSRVHEERCVKPHCPTRDRRQRHSQAGLRAGPQGSPHCHCSHRPLWLALLPCGRTSQVHRVPRTSGTPAFPRWASELGALRPAHHSPSLGCGVLEADLRESSGPAMPPCLPSPLWTPLKLWFLQ